MVPAPAFNSRPFAAKVRVTPPAELLKIERSPPFLSESEVMLPEIPIVSISVVSFSAPIVTAPVADKLPVDAIVNWSPDVFAPWKTMEVAETGVFTVMTLALVVNALIPNTVSVPEPSPKVTSPAVATLMSKLSEVAVTVLPKETSSESVPPVTFKAMSELNEIEPT